MAKLLLSILFIVHLQGTQSWITNANDAFSKAKTEHKYVLLNFSGSDWCGPCIRMHEEIFGNKSFTGMATENLILLNADFPRQKKNRLSAQQQKQNDQLADKYNPNGLFPYTLLLDEKGNVLASWDGFPKEGAESFAQDVLSVIKKHS